MERLPVIQKVGHQVDAARPERIGEKSHQAGFTVESGARASIDSVEDTPGIHLNGSPGCGVKIRVEVKITHCQCI
jgi:hypothetical protein